MFLQIKNKFPIRYLLSANTDHFMLLIPQKRCLEEKE